MIALFAKEKRCAYKAYEPSVHEEQLRALVKRRDNLVDILVGERLRLSQPLKTYCDAEIKELIYFLEQQINAINKRIECHIKTDVEMQKKIEILESVPSIGKVVAAAIVAEMPELGNLGRRQVAALIGVAPYTKQSGTYKGKSMVSPSRVLVRKKLFMAALVATRHNKKLKTFYDRLCASGKLKMVALVAVIRKLIVMLNAMVRDGKKWEENIQSNARSIA
jgi:transposase